MFCSNCGQKNEPGDRFCRSCGSVLGASTPAHKGGSSRLFKPLAILGGLLVVILVLVAVSRRTGDHASPEAAVKSFFQAMERGNIAQVIRLIDPEILVETNIPRSELEESLTDGVERFQEERRQFASAEYIVGEAQIDNDTAQVEITVKVKEQGESETQEFTDYFYAVKRQGKWYLDANSLQHMFY